MNFLGEGITEIRIIFVIKFSLKYHCNLYANEVISFLSQLCKYLQTEINFKLSWWQSYTKNSFTPKQINRYEIAFTCGSAYHTSFVSSIIFRFKLWLIFKYVVENKLFYDVRFWHKNNNFLKKKLKSWKKEKKNEWITRS